METHEKLAGQLCIFGEDPDGLALPRFLDGLDQPLEVLLVVVTLK